MENETPKTTEIEQGGVFLSTLKRNNKQIRDDRAQALYDSALLFYRRLVEDLEVEMKSLQRDRNNMLDLSPTTADSLVLASDFNGKVFAEKDLEIGLKIRNLQIKLDVSRDSYKRLFGA